MTGRRRISTHAAESSRRRLRAALTSSLPAPDWLYLIALLVPAALFDLTLSWLRVTSQYAAPTGLAALGQLRSDVLAHLGFALLWVAALALWRSGWRRIVLLVVAQVSVAGYLLFAVVAHSYYRKSGSILDAGGLRMTLQDPEATRNIAASETSSANVWLLVAVAAYAILGPALVYRLRYRGRSPRGRWLPGIVSRNRLSPTGSGRRRPAPSQTAYELRTVAAPFGSCTEPANVKAGGGACPIRFQCAGCGFYRADPSYLPAIEDHIQALAADRERATAMGVDDFVIRNFNDQISAYQHVLEGMRTRLAGYGDEERHEVEQAAALLRKVRAGLSRPQLPIIAVSAGPR